MVSPEFHWNALGLGFVFIRVGEGAECQNYTIPVGIDHEFGYPSVTAVKWGKHQHKYRDLN
jgi:hypothetical protein